MTLGTPVAMAILRAIRLATASGIACARVFAFDPLAVGRWGGLGKDGWAPFPPGFATANEGGFRCPAMGEKSAADAEASDQLAVTLLAVAAEIAEQELTATDHLQQPLAG